MTKKISLTVVLILICSCLFAAWKADVSAFYSVQRVNLAAEGTAQSVSLKIRTGKAFDRFSLFVCLEGGKFSTIKSVSRFCEIAPGFDCSARIGSEFAFDRVSVLAEAGIRSLKPYLMVEADIAVKYSLKSFSVVVPLKYCFNRSGSIVSAGIGVGVQL